MNGSDPLLTLRAVCVSHGSVPMDLVVRAGERLAILAPESFGKSRLLRVMAGLIEPASGAVIRPEDGGVGVLFRVPELRFLCATPREEVGLAPAARGVRGDDLNARVEAALRRAGLDGACWDRGWHLFSASEKYRVGVAILYALRPRLLLIDEPGNPLSDSGEVGLAEDLRVFCLEHGVGLVVFTSREGRAGLFGERVVRMEGGKG
ncbi:Energy-coupling factor transport system ATP [Candidatus Magnetaquicoccaceae bacterium FCR-1]|uniref:Energy-coupling factor transport system ATP n=1 Tax=Candidatus Magnetaquiglobus chichijimensis TaxID=3141448 RepID=A0ABQ0CCB0_9PROT